jgi:prepilin-type N-terminal cleavage/methylation domain-containing protein
MNRRLRGFSLAEVLIALAILGFGLVIIGATLPAGLRVMQQNQIVRQAEATSENVFDVLESQVRLSNDEFRQRTMIPLGFRRDPTPPYNWADNDGDGLFDIDGMPPSVTAWPLVSWNVRYDPEAASNSDLYKLIGDREPFRMIAEWLENYEGVSSDGTACFRYYLPNSDVGSTLRDYVDWLMPAIRPGDRVFPPVVPQEYRTVKTFFDDKYEPQRTLGRSPSQPEERYQVEQMRTRELAWTTFYRPINPAVGEYEMITIVTKRPSAEHFYPVQAWRNAPSGNPNDLGDLFMDEPEAVKIDGKFERRVAPVPWLVAFRQDDGLPFDNAKDLILTNGLVDETGGDRPIESYGPLVFKCNPELSPLLPKGAQFFPAIEILSGGISHLAMRLDGAEVQEVRMTKTSPDGFVFSDDFITVLPTQQVSLAGETRWVADGLQVGTYNTSDDMYWRMPDNNVYVPDKVAFPGTPEDYLTGKGIAYVELPVDPLTVGQIRPWEIQFTLPKIGDYLETGFMNHAPVDRDALQESARPYVRVERLTDDLIRTILANGPGRRCEQQTRNLSVLQTSSGVTPDETIVLRLTCNINDGRAIVAVGEDGGTIETKYHTNDTGELQSFPSIAGVLPFDRANGSLPIFEVIDRPDDETIIVRNEGLAPWVSQAVRDNDRHLYWPVWIVPPPFDTESSASPNYDSDSPIVSIQSQTVRLPLPKATLSNE